MWLSNCTAFGLLYWEMDSGGPAVRAHGLPAHPDFAFPQQLNPELAPADWRPRFIDYLYLGFTSATAFSPTDVSPLRAFFVAQDGYFGQRAALSQLQAANRALHTQIVDLHSAAYIERQAREQFQLVPAGLQAFVVKGLPRAATIPAPTNVAHAAPLRLSLGARLSDLWHTLRE